MGVNSKPSMLFSESNGYAVCVRPLNLIIASPVKHSFCHFPASWNTEFLSCVRSHTFTLP